MATVFKMLLPAFVILLTSAASSSPLVSAGMKQTAKSERKTISNAVMKSEVEKAAGVHQAKAGGAKGGSTSDIMIVDPKEVAQDWKQAFNMLKVKQTGGILFHLANGEKISDIVSIDALQGGYLMFFTIKNLHGLQYKIIKTSEIVSLSTK